MAVRRRATWSSNEYFAHKKNIGEEVKLKDTITTIERVLHLTKDSMRHQLSEVRTSLKNLRKSTGHSIEALPPTPFQKYSHSPSPLPLIRPEVSFVTSDKLPPELRYLENDIDTHANSSFRENPGFDGGHDDLHPNTNQFVHSDRNNQLDIGLIGDAEDHLHAIYTKIQSQDSNQISASLPALANKDSKAHVGSPGNSGIGLGTVDNHGKSNTKLPILTNSQNIVEIDHGNGEEDQPYSLKHEKDEMSHLNCNEQHLISEPTRLSIASSKWTQKDKNDTKTCLASMRQSNSTEHDSKTLLKRRKGGNSQTRDNLSSFRDIRNRCRTCLERFRQNAEFRRLRRQMGEKDTAKNLKEDKPMGRNVLPSNKPFMTPTLDLESVLSDEVLDFDDKYVSMTTCTSSPRPRKTKVAKKGYSRQWLDQLAEPRGGRKRRLFSKQLIKKEADILIESHAQPQMTDKEKERLRRIQSKIRMFLAMMQNSAIPTRMVDIPQREDIMKVDISHH